MTNKGNVLWHVTMSLDGFIAGPDDSMDWVFDYAERTPEAEEVIETTGAMLAGRRWYDVASGRFGGGKGIFGGDWTGPVFLFTHQAPQRSGRPAAHLRLQRHPRRRRNHARVAEGARWRPPGC